MVDRYTKAVLTVIAACLLVIVARQNAVPPAAAQVATHVVVDEISQSAFQFVTVPVRVKN